MGSNGVTWRLLPPVHGDPASELAAGTAMLAGLVTTHQPALRWYTAGPQPALVIGSGQKLSEVDQLALRQQGVTLHRRASGGTAVLFVPGFLMQDIALPLDHPLAHPDVSESYRWLGEVWQATLMQFGIQTRLIDIATARTDRQMLDTLTARACFGGRSPYELLVNDRKLVGFAQVRRREGMLFQVGVYTHWPGQQLSTLLAILPAERQLFIERLAGRVTDLATVCASPPDLHRLATAFATVLHQRYDVRVTSSDWTEEELKTIASVQSRFLPLDLEG
ncbi:ligase [Chloroflexus sp. MS-CIW-1]|uniref:lipoate--protein ligase family protein n=1 Tax=Chloroflexus sp. MS-CIW-1 TaxID=3055768 RepID=UPI0026490533|nr:ligase [Chloroflexus sp. MS-CIW-1]MDN5273946.1 ligase [Chloroflexus sp. MS-CIW-1]